MGWKSNVVVVNNQSATRKLFLLQFHSMLTKTTLDFHHRIELLVTSIWTDLAGVSDVAGADVDLEG